MASQARRHRAACEKRPSSAKKDARAEQCSSHWLPHSSAAHDPSHSARDSCAFRVSALQARGNCDGQQAWLRAGVHVRVHCVGRANSGSRVSGRRGTVPAELVDLTQRQDGAGVLADRGAAEGVTHQADDAPHVARNSCGDAIGRRFAVDAVPRRALAPSGDASDLTLVTRCAHCTSCGRLCGTSCVQALCLAQEGPRVVLLAHVGVPHAHHVVNLLRGRCTSRVGVHLSTDMPGGPAVHLEKSREEAPAPLHHGNALHQERLPFGSQIRVHQDEPRLAQDKRSGQFLGGGPRRSDADAVAFLAQLRRLIFGFVRRLDGVIYAEQVERLREERGHVLPGHLQAGPRSACKVRVSSRTDGFKQDMHPRKTRMLQEMRKKGRVARGMGRPATSVWRCTLPEPS